ncbi:MAG: sn-glycerol-3-phosphate ABC transporter permease UgpE [Holophaga sp.]|nr:sn-glycerol-3-phosphate ABC transporter permease UgpE [Holophaga sp.]
MVERNRFLDVLTWVVVIAGIALVCFPVYVTFVASSLTSTEVLQSPMTLIPGPHLIENYRTALFHGVGESSVPVGRMLFNSLVLAMGVAVGKIVFSILSAYAVVYFRFPFRKLAFWAIFVTLMLPVEVRIMPTYKVVSDLGLINTRTGMIMPIIASATATFLFRQMFLTVPDELTEAARVDGASPMQFFWNILLPLSATTIAALFVIQFIYGWNQYLWPLLITTDRSLTPIVVGVTQMISRGGDAATEWNLVMATVMLAMIPPAVIVVLLQRWFVKGLIETEK